MMYDYGNEVLETQMLTKTVSLSPYNKTPISCYPLTILS